MPKTELAAVDDPARNPFLAYQNLELVLYWIDEADTPDALDAARAAHEKALNDLDLCRARNLDQP